MNLLGSYFQAGDLGPAIGLASRLATSAKSPMLRDIGAATRLVLDVTLEGDLDRGLASLETLTETARRRGHTHYEGVSLLNSSLIRKAQGAAAEALRDATGAVEAFSRGSAGWELQAAKLAQAWAYAHLGDLEQARALIAVTNERSTTATRPEWLLESTEIETRYGDEATARSLADELIRLELSPSMAALSQLAIAELALRLGDVEHARRHLPVDRPTIPTQEPGFVSHYLTLMGQLALLTDESDAHDRLREARAFAARQGARLWADVCQVLLIAVDPNEARARRLAGNNSVALSFAAEVLTQRLHGLDEAVLAAVTEEAQKRPERWRSTLRRAVNNADQPSRVHAARILDRIGGPSDVPLLRSIARLKGSLVDSSLGRGLARRLAAPVMVEDQNRVQLQIGSSCVSGADLRRKVLAMMCFLLTKPGYAATRDEVIDALWPDLAPEVAVNSLNQTVYFLRRVFEPGYKEDTSAGYVQHQSDVLWLDSELIHSRSRLCRELIDSISGNPSPQDVEQLSDLYQGPFALDFTYEEWAVPYRDGLHVGYVHLMESAVNRDLESGHYDRGIRLAKRALSIDPALDNVELSLLRLYRATGAHSAAAEQYAHYSSYLREEHGLEAPPLSSL
jgi:DNA-binding SARP family transcriptional activator